MPGLSDLARSFKTVEVGGVKIDVPGISAEGVAYLFHRFPVIREMISGREVQMDVETISKLAPEAIAAIIAVGTGSVNSPEDEATAAKLGVEVQIDLIEAIVKETVPGGVGPFVERLTGMFNALAAEATSIQDGKLPSALNTPSRTASPSPKLGG